MPKLVRERWGTKLGVILAVSGSAVGLGNFLRFPTQATMYGPGVFMIPYLVALIVVGIPLVWVEWTLGRHGGRFGHSAGPGIFQTLAPKLKILKYVGVLAVFGPMVIFTYYCYIESWTLGYSIFSALDRLPKVSTAADTDQMKTFLNHYRGLTTGKNFGAINLDDYVTDLDDDDSTISWTYRGNVDLLVEITDRIATISAPDDDYLGSENIIFIATDPGHLTSEDTVLFTVAEEDNPRVLDSIVAKQETGGDTLAVLVSTADPPVVSGIPDQTTVIVKGGNFGLTYGIFLVTFVINMTVLYFGLRGGIEKVCNFALPTLLILAIILAVRVLTLPTPPGQEVTATPLNGLGYLWNQDFSQLGNPKIWLAAAGQVFFTLSVGMGVILTYSSYLRKKDDVALSGLTAATANEFAEVVLAGSIIVPAAFVFFGPAVENIQNIAASGSFDLGFVTMPLIFQQIPGGIIFGFLWFFMLFLAGVTSSISICQPAVAFMKNEFGIKRGYAVLILASIMFILCQPAIWFLKFGVMDDLDFWAANFIIVIGALIEIILFGWIFGSKKGWQELHQSAKIKVPGFFRVVIKYITPLFLIVILGVWMAQNWMNVILMKTDPDGNALASANKPYILMIRLILLALFLFLSAMVYLAYKRRKGRVDISDNTVENENLIS